jgi:hypothetical protein
MLPWAVAEATATPAPPQPSTVLPWTLVGLGAASLAAGVFAGIDGFSRDNALANEFKQPAATGIYKSLATYQEESKYVGQEKTVCLVAAVAGAALLAGGIFLFPADSGASGGGGGLALVPTFNGATVVGVFP